MLEDQSVRTGELVPDAELQPGACNRTYVYKLRPTCAQRDALDRYLDVTRNVYNAALEQRRTAYRFTGRSLNWYDQKREIKELRAVGLLDGCHVHAVQDALRRLDRAFVGFFAGRGGFPRFRGTRHYRSFTFSEFGNGVRFKGGRLHVTSVGPVKIRLHRPLQGKPKTATLVRKADGWHAHIVCEVTPEVHVPGKPAVGIDMGIAVFATLSTGETVANPRYADRHRRRIAHAQRTVSRRKRGSKRRAKAVRLLAKAKQTEARARRDFHHKASRSIAERYGTIAVEDLKVAAMVRSAKGTVVEPGRNVAQKCGLNRSIQDAGWGQFILMLDYKAEVLVKVDPRYTSQECAECGVVDRASRPSQAVFRCVGCGHEANADHNAASNILNRARARSVVEAAHVAA
jgi:putative transposase